MIYCKNNNALVTDRLYTDIGICTLRHDSGCCDLDNNDETMDTDNDSDNGISSLGSSFHHANYMIRIFIINKNYNYPIITR